MSGHTLGPWVIYKRDPHPDIAIEPPKEGTANRSAFNQGVCELSSFECRARPEEAMANARLIAAAPEMYALIEQIAWQYEIDQRDMLHGITHAQGQAARALLARIDEGA